MKQKNLFLFLTIALSLMLAVNSFATPMKGDTIKFTYTGTFGNANGGGEFLATDSTSGDIFKTFCLEFDEHISLGTLYTIGDISTAAVFNNSGTSNALEFETAYLYHHYFYGTLDDEVNSYYSGSPTWSYMDDPSANGLQAAIWGFESQTNGVTNFLSAMATAAVADSSWWGSTLGNVRVMNIVGLGGTVLDPKNAKQDMLVVVPEPTTILLSGLGLLGIAAVLRRKFRNKA